MSSQTRTTICRSRWTLSSFTSSTDGPPEVHQVTQKATWHGGSGKNSCKTPGGWTWMDVPILPHFLWLVAATMCCEHCTTCSVHSIFETITTLWGELRYKQQLVGGQILTGKPKLQGSWWIVDKMSHIVPWKHQTKQLIWGIIIHEKYTYHNI